MNTANLLTITTETNLAKSGKLPGIGMDSNNKQVVTIGSEGDTNSQQEVSTFENALKNSMTNHQDSQNADSQQNQALDQSASQNLPEDGKELPATNVMASELMVQQSIDNSLTIEPSENNQQTIETAISLNTSLTEAESSTLIDEAINVELIESVPEVASVVSNLTSTANNPQDHAAQELTKLGNSEPVSVDTISVQKNEAQVNQLDFIEQSQNTTTSIDVNSSAIKDVFQNITAGGNTIQNSLVQQNSVQPSPLQQNPVQQAVISQAPLPQALQQTTNEPLMVLQNADVKSESVFSGSMQESTQDSNGKMNQNFSQAMSFQATTNSGAAAPNAEQLTEFQKQLIDTDTMPVDEKIDTSKVTKNVSESLKPSIASDVAPKLTEFAVKTPMLSKGWNDEVNNHISYVAKNGGGNAKIKLNPLHLGPVEASIKIASEGGISIQINASHATTRDALDLGIARLKEMLNEQGFSQVDVNVSDQGLSKGNGESTTKAASASNHSMEGDQEGAAEELDATPAAKSTINGVVDYYA